MSNKKVLIRAGARETPAAKSCRTGDKTENRTTRFNDDDGGEIND
jgi:ribosomal protein L40E